MSELILPDDQPIIELYDYQKRYLSDTSRFKAAMFSRQSGKTFTSTLEIALDCAKADAEKRRVRWVILSRGERQAKEAMNEGLKVHLNALAAGYEAYEYDFDVDTRALEIELPYGSKVTALPANPDTARGFSANVFLDEFAIHKDSRAIWGALFPVVSKNGLKLRVVSTPKGKGNKFYEIMTADSEVWSRHVVDIHQAVADGLERNIEELRQGLNDEELWQQEYLLHWIDEASAWLDFDLINSCEEEHAGIPENYAGGMCYVGVDIAARNDLFVIWILEQVGDVFWTREIIERKRISFAEQDMLLNDVFQRYRVIRCCMDQTGMGEKPVEDAQRRYGSDRVEGVLFTGPNKLTMATRGKECFQDRRIRIPQGNDALRADLHKLKKVTGPTGTPRFEADSDSAGHADRTWAAFLALNATDGGWVSDRIITARPRSVNKLLRGYR
ncbi:terminase large subunit domain-containing protein [Acinetobacter parvus]|uniref:Terminase large subunit gp17-like C-terminal domain-containing protein n=1 Tax=Acinetobacter parvus NIPH 1103 TaxID=1217671 RepID=N8REC1_9GAMM|nr:terminase family protein [Acinetobacter parvus]ENU32437.1 hypothetical protein F989_02417 [Acinetobacter parvus NIPH 1103]